MRIMPGRSVFNPVHFAELQGDEHVLVAPCSDGQLAVEVATGMSSGAVIGVDPSARLLEKARDAEEQYREAGGSTSIDFREGSILDLPLFDSRVDLVIAHAALNPCTDRPQFLSEVRRVLKPGGRLILSDIVLEDGADKAALGRHPLATALGVHQFLDAVGVAGFSTLHILALQRMTEETIAADAMLLPAADALREAGAAIVLSAVSPG